MTTQYPDQPDLTMLKAFEVGYHSTNSYSTKYNGGGNHYPKNSALWFMCEAGKAHRNAEQNRLNVQAMYG